MSPEIPRVRILTTRAHVDFVPCEGQTYSAGFVAMYHDYLGVHVLSSDLNGEPSYLDALFRNIVRDRCSDVGDESFILAGSGELEIDSFALRVKHGDYYFDGVEGRAERALRSWMRCNSPSGRAVQPYGDLR